MDIVSLMDACYKFNLDSFLDKNLSKGVRGRIEVRCSRAYKEQKHDMKEHFDNIGGYRRRSQNNDKCKNISRWWNLIVQRDLASLFQFPSALRRLFVTILMFCELGDVRKLWCDHYDSLSEDYRKQYVCSERVHNMVLVDIRKLSEYDLPNVNEDINLQARDCHELQEEYSILIESLNPNQKFSYDEIMRHVDENIPSVFFTDGPGGTGKTFALLVNWGMFSLGNKLSEYDLPGMNEDINLQVRGCHEVLEEYSILMHMDENIPSVFFTDGPGGTGKTSRHSNKMCLWLS
uniref:ATP-dependent DNA helicase n=1 Tax=Lactuca sativa TaxID=4236 RepID=A0A9R1XL59_LACSA|nr:hypothetical protein LSAT_V11C400175200 [Lactuca sativa]